MSPGITPTRGNRMAQAPGWYPDPIDPSRNLYWDGSEWQHKGAPTAPAGPPPKKRKRHTLLWIIGTLLVLGFIGSQCSPSDTTSGGNSSSGPTTKKPSDSQYMEGNGTFKMGMSHDWGVWQSDGTTGVTPGRNCKWSIVSIARYRGGETLDQGEAPAGEQVTVNIQPDGSTHWDGTTIGEDNHEIVFINNNCGAWTVQR